MDSSEGHEQDLHDFIQSLTSVEQPSQQSATRSTPEAYVQELLAEFTHQPDEEAYYDAIYEDIAADTDDEEEVLWDDNEDKSGADFIEEDCVSNFSSHVAAVKEDCSGCDHMHQLVGLDSEDVSASLASSSAPSQNRMTDFQLKQRALTFNIYDFSVSNTTNIVLLLVIFLFICH